MLRSIFFTGFIFRYPARSSSYLIGIEMAFFCWFENFWPNPSKFVRSNNYPMYTSFLSQYVGSTALWYLHSVGGKIYMHLIECIKCILHDNVVLQLMKSRVLPSLHRVVLPLYDTEGAITFLRHITFLLGIVILYGQRTRYLPRYNQTN